jgi:hypothetical protein
MQRLLTALNLLGSGLLLVVACSDDTGNLFSDPDAGSLGGLPGSGGSGGSSNGGRAGVGGVAGVGGGPADMGGSAGSMSAGSGGQDAGGSLACNGDADCDDQNACTTERCQEGACVDTGFAAAGAACGSATDNLCTAPDTCNGAGVCQPNDNPGNVGMPCGSNTEGACTHAVCGNGACLTNDEPNGTACTDGSCTAGQCVTGQPVGCPIGVASSVPFDTSWSSVGRPNLFDGSCEAAGIPDYSLLFTAPQAGTFRFSVHALVDSTPYTGVDPTEPPAAPPDGDAVITVANGSCAGPTATQLGCNDDLAPGNVDSQLELVLTDHQVITVYLTERTQTGGGTGTLSITLQPPPP